MLKFYQDLPSIYGIFNQQNTKVYVGSTYYTRVRLYKHVNALRRNKHDNIYLQNDFNKYGEVNYRICILEYLPKDNELLENKELFWYNHLKEKYTLFNLVIPCRDSGPKEYQGSSHKRFLRDGTTPALGYSIDNSGHYVPRLALNGVDYTFGYYKTKEEALTVYNLVKNITDEKQLTLFSQSKRREARLARGRKYKGTVKRKTGYGAEINVKSKTIRLGFFATEEEAALMYNQYVIENNLDRELNIIDNTEYS